MVDSCLGLSGEGMGAGMGLTSSTLFDTAEMSLGVEEEYLIIDPVTRMVVPAAAEVVESAGFLSACSLAWSFFQLLDRSVVVSPGMTGTMIALLVLKRGISGNMRSGSQTASK